MNNVFATSSSVPSAKTLERQSGKTAELMETGGGTQNTGSGSRMLMLSGSAGVVAGGTRTSRLVGTSDVVCWLLHLLTPSLCPYSCLSSANRLHLVATEGRVGTTAKAVPSKTWTPESSPPLYWICPPQPPPITSSANMTHFPRCWHFAGWTNIFSGSSKSGSLKNRRKIWTKIAVRKSVC